MATSCSFGHIHHSLPRTVDSQIFGQYIQSPTSMLRFVQRYPKQVFSQVTVSAPLMDVGGQTYLGATVRAHGCAVIPRATQTWQECATDAGSKPGLPRSGHVSAVLPTAHSSDAIIFGGYTEDENMQRSATNETWMYCHDKWTQVQYRGGACPQARLVTQAINIGNDLYIIGGWDPGNKGDGGQILNDIWKLDLEEYCWKEVSIQGIEMQPLSRHQAFAVGPIIYIHTHRTLDTILALDTSTKPPTLSSHELDTSRDGAPSSRGLHTLTAIGKKAYLFGGAPKQGGMLGDLWELDLAEFSWKRLEAAGRAPHVRCSHSAAVDGRDIIYFGGSYYKSEGGLEALNDLFVLDTEECCWRVPPVDALSAPSPRNAHASAVLRDKKLMLVGGWNPFRKSYNDTFLLDLAAIREQ